MKTLTAVPVLADSRRGGVNPQDDNIETSGGEARESTNTTGTERSLTDSRGGSHSL